MAGIARQILHATPGKAELTLAKHSRYTGKIVSKLPVLMDIGPPSSFIEMAILATLVKSRLSSPHLQAL